MYTYEIKHSPPNSKSPSKPPTRQQRQPSSNPSTKEDFDLKAKILAHHFCKFWGDVGDTVHFRAGPYRGKKRDRTPWKVVEVAATVEESRWTKDGRVPQYIKLEGIVKGEKITVWTCETQLINVGRKGVT